MFQIMKKVKNVNFIIPMALLINTSSRKWERGRNIVTQGMAVQGPFSHNGLAHNKLSSYVYLC